MTDRFEVPEPSREAEVAFYNAPGGGHRGTLDGLAAAYAVDVPRIGRAEVEAAFALDNHRRTGSNRISPEQHAYLAARFGEPEHRCWANDCPRCVRVPRAAPERCKCWDDTPERTDCPMHPWHPTERREPMHLRMEKLGPFPLLAVRGDAAAQVTPEIVVGETTYPLFTKEDRDRLAKLERFCRVWAEWQTLQATTEEMREASREYLR